jgi:hypothetical protein
MVYGSRGGHSVNTTNTAATALPEEWVMLVFNGVTYRNNMAEFVNALAAKVGDFTRDQVRVGTNAINVETTMYNRISSDLDADKFNYTVATV